MMKKTTINIQKTKTIFASYAHDRRGATAIEFAFTSIFFIILIFAIIEGGRMVWTMNSIQYTVEETSRYASLNSDLDETDYQNFANDQLKSMMINTDGLTITSSTTVLNGISFIQIDSNYAYAPIVNGILPDNFLTLSLTSTSRAPLTE